MQSARTLRLALLMAMLMVALLPAPASWAQAVPPDPGLPGPYPVEQFDVTLQGLGATVFYSGADGTVAPAACDGQVDALDIQAVATSWQLSAGQPGYDSRFDVDGDEMITAVDVQAFAAQWGWPAN